MTQATQYNLVLVERLLDVNKMPSNVLHRNTQEKDCVCIVEVVCTNYML